jgi:RNA-binding protein Musashi
VAPPSIHRNDAAAAGDDASEASHPQGGGGGGMGAAQVENNKVFIGGIPPNVDRDELKRIFEAFAPVVDSIVMMDQQMQRSRGFGFVTFEQGSNGAQNAVAAQPLFIQGRRVEVKLATPKGDAQKRLPPAAATTNLGLRAGMGSSSSGEFAGLAAAYGRSGWKAGYGTHAFGEGGWAVQGWEGGRTPEQSGFSFDLLKTQKKDAPKERPTKRVRRE